MERFFKRKLPSTEPSSTGTSSTRPSSAEIPQPSFIPSMPSDMDSSDVPWDPFDRKKIIDYHPNQRDNIRRKYLITGPCQPRLHTYPIRMIGKRARRFNPAWYDQYGSWLEYSEKADVEYVDVLEYVEDEALNSLSQRQASGIRVYLRSFDFMFHLQLMLKILGITNILAQALQRKDQDIVNAITLVKSTVATLKKMRNEGFDALILDIISVCENNDIQMVNMEEVYVNPRKRRQQNDISNRHYYEYFCFNIVLDMQIQEFGDRFSKVTFELLMCMTGLNPHDSFCDFDSSKLQKLIEFYPLDFSFKDRMDILHELSVYPTHMQQDGRFATLKTISDLARVMTETKMHLSFPLIYRLVKLSLILPVATATVERCFSAMKLVKSDLRNRISDEFLNNCVICAIEKETFSKVTNENVVKRFLLMNARRQQL